MSSQKCLGGAFASRAFAVALGGVYFGITKV